MTGLPLGTDTVHSLHLILTTIQRSCVMLCQDTFARFYGERLWIYPVNMRPQKYMDRLLRGKGGWFMDSTGFTGVCRRIYVMYMKITGI